MFSETRPNVEKLINMKGTNMKRNILSVLTALIVLTLAANAFAQEYSVDMSFMSKYIWRGSVLADDAVFQPSLSGGMGNLSVNLWGNANIAGDDVVKQMSEWDYTVDYSSAVGAIGYSVGFIGYTFPNSGLPATTEIYVGANYDTMFSPSVTAYYDLDDVEGLYVSLGAGYSIPVAEITSIDIYGSLGLGDKNMNQFLYGSGDSGAGLADVLVGVSASFDILDNYSITPCVSLSSILDSEGQDVYDTADMDYTNVFFGLTFSAAY